MKSKTELITRRKFLRDTALAGAAAIATGASLTIYPGHVFSQSVFPKSVLPQPVFRSMLNANKLARFVDPLPIPPRARSKGSRPSPQNPSTRLPYYRLEMREFQTRLHRDLKPTRQWGFEGVAPGPIFEVQGGQEILVEWVNRLPAVHFLPIDHSIAGAEAKTPSVRTVVHLHGAKTPPASDGFPEDWFQPGASALCHYPNQQDAAMLWYHDHAMGINRLNIYAGLVGAYVIRDDVETALKLPAGPYEIPLVIYDRSFDPQGALYYPVSGKPGHPWVSEFYGDAMLVNGKVFPYLEVEPRKYRFRVLNAANARDFNLTLSKSLPIYQIGTDLGLLPAPVPIKNLELFPGERADLIVDFAGNSGHSIVLKDESIEVMQFRVGHGSAGKDFSLPATLRPVTKLRETDAVKSRELTLVEYNTFGGSSLVMLLNDTHWHMPITEKPVLNSVEIWNLINLTEDAHPIHLHLVRMQILDRRPFDQFAFTMHHKLRFLGPPIPPAPNEAGWKDTVRCESGMVTRIIARFEGYPGRYVWHCHILEHEDNEMMRPYEVITPQQAARELASR